MSDMRGTRTGMVEIPLTPDLKRDMRKFLILAYRLNVDEVLSAHERTEITGYCETCWDTMAVIDFKYRAGDEVEEFTSADTLGSVMEYLTYEMEPGECNHQLHAGSRYIDPEPPEYCNEPTHPLDEYCPLHGGRDPEEDL